MELLTELLGLPGCFVKDKVIKGKEIYLEIERDGYPICPCCKQTYFDAPKDSRVQEVEDLSVCGRRCYLRIRKYRISCSCGYNGTEYLEWLDAYQRFTIRYRKWIYAFCKRMTGLDVSRIFGISKYTVYRLDKEGIEEEMATQKPVEPKRLGIDEISRKKGHRYATIVSAPDEKKILEVVKGRKKADLAPFFKEKGEDWCGNIEIVSMDAWKAFRAVIRKYCTKAAICYDHFHIAQHFSKAIDQLRVKETRKATKNQEVYKGTRWVLLKNPENLTEKQRSTLDLLLSVNRKIFIAYILRDEFREIFRGITSHSRLIRFANWKMNVRSARIGLLSEFLKKINRWDEYIKNSLRHNHSNAFAEGLNNKVRVIQRMAYGYKDFEYLRLKIFQQFNFKDVRSVFD